MDHTAVLANMGQAILHRGPDAAGQYFDKRLCVGLAHRRLSIQDLSEHGAQPMRSANRRFLIVFNGEIYNFLGLRKELEAAGYPFRGHSDTEVMLAAFEARGVESALSSFAGMFAFALLDFEAEQLWLVRDRMGEKPLYYGWQRDAFLFGSELKALRAFPGFVPAVNREALALLLRHNYIPAPHSIYRGIQKLPPAHYLRIDLRARQVQTRPTAYWSATAAFGSGNWETMDDAVDALDDTLGRIVREQMVADVPLGAFLSGGIDSSTVAALMQRHAPRSVRTFTIGFKEPGYNEADHAAAVAHHLGTDHTDLYLAPQDALDLIPKLPQIYDEPFADSSQIPTFLVSRMTRQHVTVALSGDGGDELFAGYPRYLHTLAAWQRLHGGPGLRALGERILLGLPDHLAQTAVRLLNGEQRWLSKQAVAEKIRRERLLRSYSDLQTFYRYRDSFWAEPALMVLGSGNSTDAMSEPLPAGVATLPPLQQLQWLDLHGYLPDDILTKVDRAAMAVGLETRVPMLDHRFVELALSLPPEWNLAGHTGKQMLRRLLDRYVPRELVERPKQGFAVPIAHWLRTDLREWAEALLGRDRLIREGYWATPVIRAVWEDHVAGRADFSFQLWSVLMFQAWLDEYDVIS